MAFIIISGSVALVSLVLSIWVAFRTRAYLSLSVIMIACMLVPIVPVVQDCMARSSSEACVWGQSLMPFYLGFAVIVGSIAYFVWLGIAAAFRWVRKRSADTSPPTMGG